MDKQRPDDRLDNRLDNLTSSVTSLPRHANWELFIMRLRYKEGRLMQVAGNKPVLLDDPDYAYVIYKGRLDVFAVWVDTPEDSAKGNTKNVVGARNYLFSLGEGDILFGVSTADTKMGLLASSTPGTEILRVKRTGLERLAGDKQFTEIVASLMDGWFGGMARGAFGGLLPRDYDLIELDTQLNRTNGQITRNKRGIVWIRHVVGSSRYAGRDDIAPVGTSEIVPLSYYTWLESIGESVLLAQTTLKVLTSGELWKMIPHYHTRIMHAIAANIRGVQSEYVRRLQDKAESDTDRVEDAFVRLASVLNEWSSGKYHDIDDPLFVAAQLVGEYAGVIVHPYRRNLRGSFDPLRDIARASRIRMRQVALKGEWWREDNGALLGYLANDNHPVALIPRNSTSYNLINPTTGETRRVTHDVAAELSPFAVMFYRALPTTRLRARMLLQFGLRDSARDVVFAGLMGVVVGILSAIPSVVARYIFDQVIPASQSNQLIQFAGVLVVLAIAGALFQISRSIAYLRAEGQFDADVQSAVIDRMLDLPLSFFRDYTAGDLGLRALGITQIRQTISRVATSSILSGLFGLINLVLLFIYDVRLAVLALALIALLTAAVYLTGLLLLRHERSSATLRGEISGMVLQFINGIPKFRVSGTESRAFATWARMFTEQRRETYKARVAGNRLTLLVSVFPILSSMALFALMSNLPDISTGTILAFILSFSALLGSTLSLAGGFVVAIRTVPTYERSRPLLDALPEVDATKSDPGELMGEIEVQHVSFRYRENEQLILTDISLSVRPGEFIALVGPSGSGKSTLLRLLLGFESPNSGSIFYDGQDLGGLDIRLVRRQIGTVLQTSRLMTGDIMTNIIGSSMKTVEDAWTAAMMAGLEDDIKAMPMGMQTVISEGGSTFSGGQRQRLLIARAIVTRPRIIFFDEATSALDNRTQEIVSRSLENLESTRVVIAHRLSTIINADRIYVMDRGRIVQQGTYQELIIQPGLFAELARRQLT